MEEKGGFLPHRSTTEMVFAVHRMQERAGEGSARTAVVPLFHRLTKGLPICGPASCPQMQGRCDPRGAPHAHTAGAIIPSLL